MKNKKLLIVVCVGVLAITMGFAWWFLHKDEQAMQAYAQELNQRLAQNYSLMAEAAAAETPEHKAKVEAHSGFMAKIAESQIEQIQFVGRIVDQYGEPVSDAKVAVEGGGNYLAAGSGGFYVQTDQDGFFVVDQSKGSFLAIGSAKKMGYEIEVRISKNGLSPGYPHFYGFKESEDALLWADYTREHPYVIKAYKVGKYAQVKSEIDRAFGFAPNGTINTLDFTGTDTVRWEGVRDGDIRVSATRNEKTWQIKIDGINGGVQDVNDEYMNMAPEAGYQKSLTYSGSARENFVISGGIVINKKFYFMSQHGKRYGSVKMRIRPYANERQTVIYTTYVINLEGGRELAVRPSE